MAARRRQRVYDDAQPGRRRVHRRAAVQRREDRRDRLRQLRLGLQDEATENLRQAAGATTPSCGDRGGDGRVYVSGLNAAQFDDRRPIMERLPLFLLYIIGVTFIVLKMMFRSIVVSLTAAVTTILSAFIGFGVLTLVFQEGYLLDVMGLDKTGPIEMPVPPIAFAIFFGSSWTTWSS